MRSIRKIRGQAGNIAVECAVMFSLFALVIATAVTELRYGIDSTFRSAIPQGQSYASMTDPNGEGAGGDGPSGPREQPELLGGGSNTTIREVAGCITDGGDCYSEPVRSERETGEGAGQGQHPGTDKGDHGERPSGPTYY